MSETLTDFPEGSEVAWHETFYRGLHGDGRTILGKVIAVAQDNDVTTWVIK